MKTLSAVSNPKYSEKELVSIILSHAGRKQQPVALWRLPGSALTHLIISENQAPLDREDFLEDLDMGFVFAPYDKGRPRIYLKAERFFTFADGRLQPHQNPLEEDSAQWLQELVRVNLPQKYIPGRINISLPADTEKATFMDTVRKGVREIESGILEKIVPSRTKVVALPESFDVIDSFHKLCATYPQALISFVSIPGVGNWLGASPEILVCVQDKSIFKTVALAGTLPYSPGVDLKSVAWTQKEIEEQALVERYVISCFKRIRLREYEEYGPKTIVAGNLMHLKSEFRVDMKATNFPQIGTVMLDLLHPTSAVCGMPLDPALDFLNRHEPYNRGFYAGYLGPVNVYNNIELFVNLRCMQIDGATGILYAGAGVTADSIPEKEWSETEMKLNTLLNVIL
jgi:isochorismate synthase